ncbi:unnamed protein product [Dracunculus medinensis]|uniref:Phosphomevalonate kinase n=1 Tax=Dracunculus medinensis TaxID=318479 RepID=A0A3P7PXP3_DRAME|nr:unnamed protein product [Dracunculus medinensis]
MRKQCETFNVMKLLIFNYLEMVPVVLCFSGKRKSGKDFLCQELARQFREIDHCSVVVRGISFPLKDEFAKIHQLDKDALKTDDTYKEIYRYEMVKWGEEIRRKDPTYFCKCLMKIFFTRLVRVESNMDVRNARGFQFVSGIDDAETECALDSFMEWDFRIQNDNSSKDSAVPASLQSSLEEIRNVVKLMLVV